MIDLKLIDDEEADKVFQYISREYPVVTWESCEKFVGMLVLLYPEKNYDKIIPNMCTEEEKNSTKVMSFLKGLIKIKE